MFENMNSCCQVIVGLKADTGNRWREAEACCKRQRATHCAAEDYAKVKTFATFGVTRTGSRNSLISALGQQRKLHAGLQKGDFAHCGHPGEVYRLIESAIRSCVSRLKDIEHG